MEEGRQTSQGSAVPREVRILLREHLFLSGYTWLLTVERAEVNERVGATAFSRHPRLTPQSYISWKQKRQTNVWKRCQACSLFLCKLSCSLRSRVPTPTIGGGKTVSIHLAKRAPCGKESQYKGSVMNLATLNKWGSALFYVCLEDRCDNFTNYKISIAFHTS